MATVACFTCGLSWDATQQPLCPKCLAAQWAGTNDLIRPKHDPGVLPSGCPSYRSVVTEEFVNNKMDFLEYAAANGEWHYSNQHNKYCHFTPDPLGVIPGSGIPRQSPMPTHSLDGILIADADNSPHAFAADQVQFRSEVSSGDYQPLPFCAEMGCSNRVIPGETLCVLHHTNPRARTELLNERESKRGSVA